MIFNIHNLLNQQHIFYYLSFNTFPMAFSLIIKTPFHLLYLIIKNRENIKAIKSNLNPSLFFHQIKNYASLVKTYNRLFDYHFFMFFNVQVY